MSQGKAAVVPMPGDSNEAQRGSGPPKQDAEETG